MLFENKATTWICRAFPGCLRATNSILRDEFNTCNLFVLGSVFSGSDEVNVHSSSLFAAAGCWLCGCDDVRPPRSSREDGR